MLSDGEALPQLWYMYLWIALIAAAAVVGFMAIKLARDMFASH